MSFLTTAEVAALVGVSQPAVHQAVYRKQLKAEPHVPGTVREFSPAAVEAWMEHRRTSKRGPKKGTKRPAGPHARSGRGINEHGTPYQHLQERRTDEELEALLDEALAEIRTGRRRPVPSYALLGLPF